MSLYKSPIAVKSSSASKSSSNYQQNEQLQKKISFLESQIKIIKQQSKRKLQRLMVENQRLRRDNQLAQRGMVEENQRLANQWEEKIKTISEQARLNAAKKEQFYQNIINQKQLTSMQITADLQSRYQNIIEQHKQQNQSLQKMLINKQSNPTIKRQHVMTFGHEQYQKTRNTINFNPGAQSQTFTNPQQSRTQKFKEKLQLMQQLYSARQNLEKLSKQLQFEKNAYKKLQREKNQKIQSYQEEISLLKSSVSNLEDKLSIFEKDKNRLQEQYLQKLSYLQEENEQLQAHVKQCDQSYLKLLQARTLQQTPQTLTTIKSCNHAGLINQMEKNLQLKDTEIRSLKQKLNEWQKMFGFDKNVDERLKDLGNAYGQTERVYRNQKERLTSGADKLDRKLVNNNK